MEAAPVASVIVVNWNGKETLVRCIESLLRQTLASMEIIVVDNHSEDGSYESGLQAYGSRVTWIRNDQNEGFARGNNIGIRASRGRHILLLNNDAWAEAEWAASLVRAVSGTPRIGMAASRIYLETEGKVFDNTGHLVYPDGLSWGRGRLEKDSGQFDLEEEVIFPSGCAALYKKELLDETGIFDERFFAYCEDTDLGLRARHLGWKCVYVPDAVVHHSFSRSTSAASGRKAYLVERNRIWVMIKNYPLAALLVSPWYTLERYFWQFLGALSGKGMTGQYLRRNSWFSGLTILARSWLAGLIGGAAMIGERRGILGKSRLRSSEFAGMLRKWRATAREVAWGEKS